MLDLKIEQLPKGGKYKWRLQNTFSVETDVVPLWEVSVPDFIVLSDEGKLSVLAGYAWDGATGVPDTEHILAPSCVHDAFYQLMREGLLCPVIHRKLADECFRRLCKEQGMSRFPSALVYAGVRLFGGCAARPK